MTTLMVNTLAFTPLSSGWANGTMRQEFAYLLRLELLRVAGNAL